MATKFSEFFKLAPNPEPIQQRIYDAVSNTVNIVDCYIKLYEYIVGGLRWSIMKQRHDLMDNTVDISGLNQVPNQEQMQDAIEYFAGTELGELENQSLFEFFAMTPQSEALYGPHVFSLMFDSSSTALAKKAYRQVRFYSQIVLYNDEYATHLAYHNANPSTKPLPGSPYNIDPTDPLNPDNSKQVSDLTNAAKALETWVTQNYPVLALVVNETSIFSLVFDQAVFTYDDKIDAIGMMLDKIRYLGKSNAPTRRAFGLEALTQLQTNSNFWSDKKISPGVWAKIKGLEPQFKKNATANAKILDSVKSLFAAFLSMKTYPGEPNPDTRRSTALLYIGAIFKASFGTGKVPRNYADIMGRALKQVQSEYTTRYTNNLIRARATIPTDNQINPILPTNLAEEVKEKADECLKTLPLLLTDNVTKVRFFTIPNYNDLKALNEKSVNVTKFDQHRSSVVVPSDPDEDDIPLPRPIYRSIRFGFSTDEYIAFCNLPKLQNGTFYYRHVDEPAIAKVPAKSTFGRVLTIDFQNYTIDYPGKKDKTKNDAGEAYRIGGSTVNFYTDLKRSTRWENIKGVRRYDPYYQTNQLDPVNPIPHLTGFVAAGGRGARALPLVEDELCVWWWNCAEPYPSLGAILGLPATRQIAASTGSELALLNTPDKGFTVGINGQQCDFYNYGPVRFQSNKFYFQIIGITPPGKPQEFYVRVNTPFEGVAEELTKFKQKIPRRASRPLEDTPKDILSLFDFCYYRRITSIKDDDGDIDFADSSKVIQLFKSGDKRKPSGPATEELTWPVKQGYDAVGVNLPICFNIPENIIQYFIDKQSRGKVINKGDALYREQKPRKDAGTAMKALFNLLKQPFSKKISSSKVPATPFANGAMALSLLVREDWGVLKLSSSNYMPVSQEWCHLRGHGDGGEEYPGNFVSGSYHCNTEQLAIETGQRLVTQQEPERSFVLHTTAYLLRDAKDYKSANQADQESQILSDNYLRNENTYQKMLANNIARRSLEKSKKVKVQLPPPQQGAVAPLAAYLRYKVMRCEQQGGGDTKQPKSNKRKRDDPEEKRLKSFDFIFEGQSEFIDVHQFTITSQAVRFALAGLDKFRTWYMQEKEELDAKTTT